jgi:low affinity Fe/Cu permease
MVFLIQNTQNRDTTAIQLKLDELIRANENARDQMLRLEDLTENQIKHLKESFATTPPIDAIRQPLEAAQKDLQRRNHSGRKDDDPFAPALESPPWEGIKAPPLAREDDE